MGNLLSIAKIEYEGMKAEIIIDILNNNFISTVTGTIVDGG